MCVGCLPIRHSHCKLRNGYLYICTPAKCKLKRIGQDTFPFVEKPNLSEKEHPRPNNHHHFNNNNNTMRNYRPRINNNNLSNHTTS
ncbi:hypothetical protein BY458DRAFT_526714 [Sporodiniella umbellata]|nr:hypothetical protein BY458DRAFT_526714 [Sporodiniella umbellata]